MEKPPKRPRGAPKGNKNAAKHDFYSKILNETERLDFDVANGVEGIDEEIALLRLEIKKAVSGGDERNLLLLVKATSALERLIRTRYKITSSQRKDLKEKIGEVIKDILLTVGSYVSSAVIIKKLTG
jgi:hypothetical protein